MRGKAFYWSGLLLGVGSIAFVGLVAENPSAHLGGVAACVAGVLLALRFHRA